jgi:tetratricopeptide (TPR) repeat protein
MKLTVSYPLLLLLLIIVFIPSVTVAQSNQELFEQGNEAYSKRDFSGAVEIYEQLTATSGYGAGLLFNLGNSYARSGQTGKAILNYERALRLAPSDSDIQGNLELVRKESGLFPREYSWSERFFQLLDLNQWTISAFLLLLLFSTFQLASLKLCFSVQVRRVVTGSCCILFILCAAGAFSRQKQWQPSVVTENDSRLLLSPFDSAASTSSIQQGRLVYPEKTHGKFSYITDETRRKGWISSSAIEPVIGIKNRVRIQ